MLRAEGDTPRARRNGGSWLQQTGQNRARHKGSHSPLSPPVSGAGKGREGATAKASGVGHDCGAGSCVSASVLDEGPAEQARQQPACSQEAWPWPPLTNRRASGDGGLSGPPLLPVHFGGCIGGPQEPSGFDLMGLNLRMKPERPGRGWGQGGQEEPRWDGEGCRQRPGLLGSWAPAPAVIRAAPRAEEKPLRMLYGSARAAVASATLVARSPVRPPNPAY